jgi:two-component system OmpR family sensor kinase
VSLRARLLAVLAVLAAAGLLAADLATYTALRSFLVDRVDATLAASAEALERPLRGPGLAQRRVLERLATLAPGVYIELRDLAGAVAWSGALTRPGDPVDVPSLPAELPNAAGGAARITVPAEGGGADFRVRVEALPFGGTLLVAAPLDDVEATLGRLVLVEVVVSLSVVAALVALGLLLVRLGLRPLRAIEETAGAIAAGDLSRRIEDTSERTEVGRLGRALNAMLAQIERAFAERTASEERLRRFVSDASHELRTPLAAVQAYAELFARGARDRPADLERAMTGIERESRRMGVLVDDLLLLARLDQGRPLAREEVDLAAVAAEAVDAARAVDPARPLALDAPAPVVVEGDPVRLRQVADNLLANVRAHTLPGTPARVSVSRDGDGAVLEVADEGSGMPSAVAAHAFERFYRGDPSRSRDAGGSGLGLAIVEAIARAHGGTASVVSEPGRGASFRVRVPARPDGVAG